MAVTQRNTSMRLAFLSDDHEEIRRELRRFVETECPQSEMRLQDREGRFPHEQWEKLAAIGWLAAALPEESGGAGAGVVEQAIVTEELARASASLGIAYFTSNCFGVNAIRWSGTDVAKERFLPGLADGTVRVVGSFTEPDGGSDLFALRSRARRDGTDWVLNGRKVYTTGAGHARAAITVMRSSEPGEKRYQGLTEFIVPLDLPGVEIRKMQTLGLHQLGTYEVYYDDVRVPDDYVVGEPDEAWWTLVKTLNNERILAGAWAIGNATRAIDEALRFAAERTAFGGPIGRFQAVQHHLAASYANLQAARLAVYNAAMIQDRGDDAATESIVASYTASEAGFQACHSAMRVFGGQGYTVEESVERCLRDAQVAIIGPSTNELALNTLAERLGLPKSY